MAMLLSLIIPIYNVEQYIKPCLESILNQKISELPIEIILVDDGSPDQSVLVAQQYLAAQTDEVQNKFKWVHQKNKGLSGARNSGINIAKGKYIAFLDSDDLLGVDYFSVILNCISTQNSDVIEFRAQRFDNNGLTYQFLNKIRDDGIYNLDNKIWQSLCNQSAWFAWLRIYKAELFQGIRFPEGVNYEDAYTTPYLYMCAKNIYFLDRVLVKYRVNPASITATKSKKNIDDLGGAAFKMCSYFEDYPFMSATALSLAQSYVNDSLNAEGFSLASKRWLVLKKKFNSSHLSMSFIENRGNKLFYFFGVYSLYFFLAIRKSGILK